MTLAWGSATAPANSTRAAPQTRYSLAGGCYGLRSLSSGQFVAKSGDGYRASAPGVDGAEPFRMQASALGRYLLYGAAGDFVAMDSQNRVVHASTPSADWQVDAPAAGSFTLSPSAGKVLAVSPGTGQLVLAEAASAGAAAQFAFETSHGCAQFPEAELNAVGQPFKGASPEGDVMGFMDGHFHWTAFEFIGGQFHCGKPWDAWGVTYALPDCANYEGPQGSLAPTQNTLNYGSPVYPHDTRGWPTFKDWPGPNTITDEVTYYRWVERAWMAGERLVVVPLVANKALCDVYPFKHNDCDEMDTARLELRDVRELQNYVDAQNGGPGKGWFQVVGDPFEARRVINAGKLAVVPGIETSELFGCSGSFEAPACDRAQIDRELDDFVRLGVRSYFLVNKFDNALAGVRFDSGPIGLIINGGNKLRSGNFWQAKTCTGPEHDNEITPAAPDNPLLATPFGQLVQGGAAPVYPPGPHCNTRGLSPLGTYLVHRLIQKHLILEIDHLSVPAGDQAVAIMEAARYSGIISAHSWIDPHTWPAIYRVGGMVAPHAGSTTGFAAVWNRTKPQSSKRYYFGFGMGSDVNGLSEQGGPRGANTPNPIRYPFKSFDGKVTFDRQRSGERVFDFNTEGLAHYGLYADWVKDLELVAGRQATTDLFRSAEAYLEMWERAQGVAAQSCRSAREGFTGTGLGAVRLGDSPERLLLRAGQPATRPGRLFRYCVAGRGSGETIVAAFTPQSTIGLIAKTARGAAALGVGPGDRSSRLNGRARSFGKGVLVGRSGSKRFFFGVRRGRIAFVAVATGEVAKTASSLRSYLRLAGLA